MTNSEFVVCALAAIIVLLPPRWDPAVRIKEWQIKHWGIKP